MSLNGLDSDAIRQAHQEALSEAGGWFIVKYITRDTVELLKKGNGGVAEARGALQSYEEKSPLYGLVHFRRKKIILKYVPDGTSRLLQARLTVQFQSVLDALIPHDTVFFFTAPEELSDSALGLSGIAPSIGSDSASNSSLRQKRLKQIAEDNEDNVPAVVKEAHPVEQSTTAINTQLVQEASPALGKDMKVADEIPAAVTKLQGTPQQEGMTSPPSSIEHENHLPASAAKAKALLAKHREETAAYEGSVKTSGNRQSQISFDDGEDKLDLAPQQQLHPNVLIPARSSSIHGAEKELPLPPPPPTPPPPSEASKPQPVAKPESSDAYRISLDQSLMNFEIQSDSDDDLRRPTPKAYAQPKAPSKAQPRFSNLLTADENTSINRWTENVSASTQKKEKRTSKESALRPRTAGGIDGQSARPVANLPTTVRVTSRQSGQSSRPGSQQSARSVPTRWAPSHNLPPPLPSPVFPTAPQAAQARNVPSNAGSYSGEATHASLEKLRLMKALQMRRRNQLLAQRSRSAASTLDGRQVDEEDQNPPPNNHKSTLNITPELASINESVVTSPTSINTASDDQSTKPSSISEHSHGRKSISSLSSDTNSSTTPRAEVQRRSQSQETTANISTQLVEETHASSTASVADTITPQPVTILQDRETPIKQLAPVKIDEPSAIEIKTAGPRKKRYHFEGTVHVPAHTRTSSDVSDDDDALMEELQNATVQEARPIAVNRKATPITPVLAKTPTRVSTPIHTINITARSGSYDSQATTPDKLRSVSRAGSVMSLATALPQWPPQNSESLPTLPKQKLTIGSTISKRVKTFEGLSHREELARSTSNSLREPPTRAASISNMLKRTSFLHNGEKVADETPEKTTNRRLPSPLRSGFDSAEKSGARPWVQRSGTAPEILLPKQLGETVSVTARIVRDVPKTAHGTGNALNMHRSTLIVERGHEPDFSAITDSTPQSPRGDRRRFSVSSHRSGSKAVSPVEATHKPNRMSLSSFKRPSRPPSVSETSSITDQKRPSKTSRMLKRLSGLGKARNKDPKLTSPTQESLHPDTIQETGELPPHDMAHVVDIGEVNVQFSESLLWKRRFLRVDDHGFLIFAPPINEGNVRGKSRKIHLDELQKPYLPDREREEMAWSILLDLKAGGTVQCGCESQYAQSSVLKMLIDAHAAYNQLYGDH